MLKTKRLLTLEEAHQALRPLVGVPLKDLVDIVPSDAKRAKGRFGSLLEDRIGLNPFSQGADFLDGELKTNMSWANGTPKETIFICQIGKLLDCPGGLLTECPMPFHETYLYKKIRNMLIVPVVKVDLPPEDWYIAEPYHVAAPVGSELYGKFRRDYETICAQIRLQLSSSVSAMIHTTNGPNYIQIRTKDGNPDTYKPMFSTTYGRNISTKRYAFYFKRDFVIDIRAGKVSRV